MKKTILALATAVSFNAATSLATENTFYVKANVGYYKLNDGKFESDNGKGPKFKSKNGNGFFGIGAGYNIKDNVRVDLVFDYFMSPTHKGSKTYPDGDFVRYNLKGDISTLTLNGYVNIFDISSIKIFTGAGLGMAQTKAKVSTTERDAGVDQPQETEKLKTSNNFTYALHLGASTEIADNLHADLTYSWRDFGEVKTKKVRGKSSVMPYRGHHLSVGVRYDI